MTVICETCKTANRDKAKFCIGCAGKLPAFAATGPAALATPEAMRRQRRSNVGNGAPSARQDNNRRLHWWLAAVLLFGGVAAASVGWIALTPGRTTATVATPSAAAPAADAVPFESALSPGESSVAAGRPSSAPIDDLAPSASASAPASPAASPSDNGQAPAQRPSSARTQTSRASGSGRADPRTGCEHLFFAFAARCEANHCAEAAYARHPRCDVVRAERQRDDARRNMTSGY